MNNLLCHYTVISTLYGIIYTPHLILLFPVQDTKT